MTDKARNRRRATGNPSSDFLAEQRQSSVFIYAVILATTLGVLIADLNTPLGTIVWIGFLVPVTLSLALWSPFMPPLIASICTGLMIWTFMTDEAGIARDIAALNRVLGVLTIWIMALVGFFFIRSRIAVQKNQWLQAGRAELGEVVGGEQSPRELAENTLRYLVSYLNAHSGAMYVKSDHQFRRLAKFGVPAGADIPESFTTGDGLMGEVAREGRALVLSQVPDGYLRLGSAMGQSNPSSLLIAPMKLDGKVNAVVELGFLFPASEMEAQMLEQIAEPIGTAVRSANYRENLRRLLEETQRQTEELQTQSEELRAANEELEEHSQTLEASQLQLERQQTTLEQTNAQLEEQTLQLEEQRDELAMARSAIELKVRELEQASQYKSDFLANMSHELRTPLNSSLILARLLADNPQGNLTEEQIKSAQTIVSAGKDLLELINDILDLSKIEAGRMEIHRQPVRLAQLVRNIDASMRPLADQKKLAFTIQVAEGCPEQIGTDSQRLEQIIRNLLSNAIKFTDQGSVSMNIDCLTDDQLSIAVSDTGIGIAEEQQGTIFEAFRQIDGSANRKYSGTGLGLSISQQLARLLGGSIHLESAIGEGSTFTVLLPLSDRDTLPAMPASRKPRYAAQPVTTAPEIEGWHIEDDRDRLSGTQRLILLVEDDEAFARILCDLVHELDFQCLVASTAADAMSLALQYLPSAVILDIGLPDQSGLTVLDRLKYDARTRHIPVHILSAGDYTETALSLGAVGFMLKPVTREALTEALKNLEARLDQSLRRVLVVEDDAVQLESLCKLLQSQDVETVGVASAAECLEQLKSGTFDCMVLDLTLPDASGYSLLETLSEEDDYSFPPVIVYTGRDISVDEEQKLRRYSRSIIIKGAKSPERLLDEVALFLHQVVSELPPEQQRMIQQARSRDTVLEGRCVLVVEDDVRNVFALTSVLEPQGMHVQIARNGREALEALEASTQSDERSIDLVLMDVMMPEMDGITATREIRKHSQWKSLPVIMLTAKAMPEDQKICIAAGASDYMSKPLDVEKLLSLVRVWIRR